MFIKMKQIFIILSFCILNISIIAQNFNTSVFGGANISLYSSFDNKITYDIPVSKNKIGFGFSFGIRENISISKRFCITSEIIFSNISASFISSAYVSAIPEIHGIAQNNLRINYLELPVYIKLDDNIKDNHNFIYYIGIGFNYVIQAHRKSDIISFDMNNPEDKQTIMNFNENINLKTGNNNKIGNFFILGLGKKFPFKNNSLFIEIRYKQDINKWIYPAMNYQYSKDIKIKNHSLLFLLGFNL